MRIVKEFEVLIRLHQVFGAVDVTSNNIRFALPWNRMVADDFVICDFTRKRLEIELKT